MHYRLTSGVFSGSIPGSGGECQQASLCYGVGIFC